MSASNRSPTTTPRAGGDGKPFTQEDFIVWSEWFVPQHAELADVLFSVMEHRSGGVWRCADRVKLMKALVAGARSSEPNV